MLLNRQAVILDGRTIAYVFDDVPDHLKRPPGPGPFEQVPAGYSTPEIGSLEGLWWRVTNFNPNPWKRLAAPEPVVFPEGFIETFGAAPVSDDYHYPGGKTQWQVDLVLWEQNLRQYDTIGGETPEGFSAAEVEVANEKTEEYDLGIASFFGNQYGVRARYPDCSTPSFGTSAKAAIRHTGHVIAMQQMRATNKGIIIPVDKMHPRHSPNTLKAQDELRKAAA